MITILVFLPLLASIVAGFGQRAIGATAAKLVTTGGLFAFGYLLIRVYGPANALVGVAILPFLNPIWLGFAQGRFAQRAKPTSTH